MIFFFRKKKRPLTQPFRVEELSTRLINPFIRMSAKEIPLCLQ